MSQIDIGMLTSPYSGLCVSPHLYVSWPIAPIAQVRNPRVPLYYISFIASILILNSVGSYLLKYLSEAPIFWISTFTVIARQVIIVISYLISPGCCNSLRLFPTPTQPPFSLWFL